MRLPWIRTVSLVFLASVLCIIIALVSFNPSQGPPPSSNPTNGFLRMMMTTSSERKVVYWDPNASSSKVSVSSRSLATSNTAPNVTEEEESGETWIDYEELPIIGERISEKSKSHLLSRSSASANNFLHFSVPEIHEKISKNTGKWRNSGG